MADGDGEIVDPELEVRKLQDLVRKLELQNDILRAKQTTSNKSSGQNSDSDSEVLNIDLVNKDEETWLYESPKQLTPEQKSMSPYQWVREPFDHSGNDSVRKSLLFKLDEIALNRKVSPKEEFAPGPGNANTWSKSPKYGNSPIQLISQQSRISSPGYPSIKQPLTSSNFNRVNTDTFTRPKKTRSNVTRYNWEGPISIDNEQTSSPLIMDQNENKSLVDIQEKKIDVHTLAKMQEESLRQSFSPLNTRRRLSRGKPGGFYLSQDENSHSSLGNHDMSPPPPRQIGLANSQNSVSSSSLNSNGSSTGASPPESVDGPYSSSHLTAPANKLRSNYSDSNLQHLRKPTSRNANNGQSQNGDTFNSHLTQPTQIVRAISPPSKLSGIPTTAGRSGIPKPGSSPRSGLPKPRRSSLPVSRMNHMNDESWKDGCY